MTKFEMRYKFFFKKKRGFFQIDQQTYFIEPLNTQNNQTTNKTKLPHLIWPKESSIHDKKIDTETTTNKYLQLL